METNNGNGGRITHHCSECGAQVVEFCADHPRAIVESAFVSHVQSVRDDAAAEGRCDAAAAIDAELNGK